MFISNYYCYFHIFPISHRFILFLRKKIRQIIQSAAHNLKLFFYKNKYTLFQNSREHICPVIIRILLHLYPYRHSLDQYKHYRTEERS